MSSLLESLFNHVALPPRLPGKEDGKIDLIGTALTERLLIASQTLRDVSRNEYYEEWDCVRRSLLICKSLNAGGQLRQSTLLKEFRELAPNDVLILHVTEQNASLLVRRQRG